MISSFHRSIRAQSMPVTGAGSHGAERVIEEPSAKTAQGTVTCVYWANVAGFWRNVTVVWCKNLMNHSLNLTMDSVEGEFHYTCKIDVKPWYFWSKKGYKSFEMDGIQVEVYWDVRAAKFSGSPEPCSDYYVALVADEEVVLLLGDNKKKAYKRTKSRPALVDALLCHKKESVFAKKSYSTRAKFEERTKDNEIRVESSTSGTKDPEMWISIDGVIVIHVRNLQWKFRGNQTVMLNTQPVQVYWDVHDWLFSTCGTAGSGLFIFKAGSQEKSDNENEGSSLEEDMDNDASRAHFSTLSSSGSGTQQEFCLLLYAWKTE